MNELYPVFLKSSNLEFLIVGGGYVALEKMTFLFKSSPSANVTMISPMYRKETIEKAQKHGVHMLNGKYKKKYLEGKHIVIATTDSEEVNMKVHAHCRKRSILVNVADNPPYCDFYMGGIVTKGNVKIGISTNGKSPTMAKRLRQFFEEILPEDIDLLAKYLNEYRDTIKGDFEEKVEKMNEYTEALLAKPKSQKEKKIKE